MNSVLSCEVPIAPSIGFPESHDTDRLAADLAREGVTDPAEQERRYKLAYAFAAAFSKGVMMPLGFEWGWTKRVDVVSTTKLDAEAKRFDLEAFIASINRMKRCTPALNEEGPQRRILLLGRLDDIVSRVHSTPPVM